MFTQGFPKHFLVDNEIYVEVKMIDADNVVGVNDLGSPYNPIRAFFNGHEITRSEFEAGAAKRRKEFPNTTTTTIRKVT